MDQTNEVDYNDVVEELLFGNESINGLSESSLTVSIWQTKEFTSS